MKSFSPDIPFDKIYQASKKEASRKKPAFFVHKYFARRITANSRLALLGMFEPTSSQIWKHFYSQSERHENFIVLDPFMGGGTTIFESLRFGCKTIGCDLQPLSLFVTKALIEPLDEKEVKTDLASLEKKVGQQIKHYYRTICPHCGKEAGAMYAFHVKRIKRPHGEENRLFSSFVLSFKNGLFTIVCPHCGRVEQVDFKKGAYHCSCGWALDNPDVSYVEGMRFKGPSDKDGVEILSCANDGEYPFSTDIIAIEYCCEHCGGHGYKRVTKFDLDVLSEAEHRFESLRNDLPLPSSPIPAGYNTNQIKNHGYGLFSDLFNKRQLLCLGLLQKAINEIENPNSQFWFQVAFSGMLEMNNMFCRYQANASKICNIFFNHAYVPITMPVENCVWGFKLGTGTFIKTLEKIIRGKKFNQNIYDLSVKEKKDGSFDSLQIYNGDSVNAHMVNRWCLVDSNHPLLVCGDSRNLSFIPDETVDLVLTDPPYGANVMYSELIDFFHVWNAKSVAGRRLGFESELSPKAAEVVVNPVANKDLTYYKNGLSSIFTECFRKLKNNGYLIFSFHDKSLDAWIALFESVLPNGYILENAFPVQSETRTGAHTSNKNSVGIDIILVFRKTKAENADSKSIEDAIGFATKETEAAFERLADQGAEITKRDFDNLFIAKFFAFFGDDSIFSLYDKKKIGQSVLDAINDPISLQMKIQIVQKRRGWWSKMIADQKKEATQ